MHKLIRRMLIIEGLFLQNEPNSAMTPGSAECTAAACGIAGPSSLRKPSLTATNDLGVRRALEAVGIEFIDENGGGPGVRLKKLHKKRT
jgi:hypothetical protein